MKQLSAMFILLFVLIVSTIAQAETRSFVREYTYKAGEADSKLSARTLALEQVKRLLLEEVGVYLESVFHMQTRETQSRQGSVVEDSTALDIQTITAGFTQTVILEEKWDGYTYYLKAKIDLDPDNVLQQVEAYKEDREELANVNALRAQQTKALQEIDSLKAVMAKLKSENAALKSSETDKIYAEAKTRYNENITILNSGDFVRDAIYAWNRKDYKGVMALSKNAIIANPNQAVAQSLLGAAYLKLHQPDSAIFHFNKALALNPRQVKTYFVRGLAHGLINHPKEAIQDFSRAIELDQNLGAAYFERGKIHFKLRQRKLAIADIRMAAQLGNPKARIWLKRAKARRQR